MTDLPPFEQPSKLPTVVAYAPKKGRYAGFVGTYGAQSVNDLLTGVLSGRVKTKTLYQQATVDAGKDCDAVAAAMADAPAEEDVVC